MSRIFKPIAVLCAVALLGGSLPVLSQTDAAPPEDARRDGPGPQMIEHLADKLDLSEAQRGQFHDIVTRYKSGALGASESALHQAREQLGKLVGDPAATEQQVLDAARSVSTASEQAAVQRHQMAVEIDSILTDAQREKTKELRAQGWDKASAFRSKHGGTRHGG